MILRACYRARKPPKPENTKKIQNPPPRVGPRKYRKNTEKIRKRPENGNFGAAFIFFSVFFLYFRGQPGAVERSIAVEDAVENRALYRVFASRLF